MTQMAFLVPSQPDELEDEADDEDDIEKSTSLLRESARPGKRRKTMGDAPSSSLYKTQTLTQLCTSADGEEEKPMMISDSEEDDDDDVFGAHRPTIVQSTPNAIRSRKMLRTPTAVPETPSNDRSVNLRMLSPSVRMLIRNSSPIGPRRSPLKDKSTNSIMRLSSLATLEKRKRPTALEREIPDSYSSAALSYSGPSETSPSKRRSPLKEIDLPPTSQRSPSGTGSALHGMNHAPSAARPTATCKVFRPADDEIPDSDDDLLSVTSTPRRGQNLSQGTDTPSQSSRALFQRLMANKENASPIPYIGPDSPATVPQRTQHVEEADRAESRSSLAESGEATTDDMGLSDLQQESQVADLHLPHQNTRSVCPDVEVGDSDSDPDSDSASGSPCPPSRTVRSQERNARIVLRTSPCPSQPQGFKPDGFNDAVISASSDITSSANRSKKHPAEIPTSDGPEITPFSSPETGAPTIPTALEVGASSKECDLPTSTHTMTPHRRSPMKARNTQRYTQAYTQAYTQMMESQRVPMEILREMKPQTARSDIVVTMHPTRAKEITDGIRNHEFRSVKLPRSVHRLWIYVARPICELRYMATIGEPREPGEIDSQTGLGNAEFNKGTTSAKWAYELEQVYLLNNPVSLERMKENGWTDNNVSQRNKYLQPAVVGQLLSNLQCALFDDGNNEPATISQEIEAQIHSDIAQSTQIAQKTPLVDEEVIEPSQRELPAAGVLSSSQTRRSTRLAMPPPPSVKRGALSREESNQSSPSQWATNPRVTRSTKNVTFSQATTASQPSTQVLATQTQSPEKPAPLLIRSSSNIDLPPANGGESIPSAISEMEHTNASSSQIFPDSLMHHDIRQPAVILDSEDESEVDDDDFFV